MSPGLNASIIPFYVIFWRIWICIYTEIIQLWQWYFIAVVAIKFYIMFHIFFVIWWDCGSRPPLPETSINNYQSYLLSKAFIYFCNYGSEFRHSMPTAHFICCAGKINFQTRVAQYHTQHSHKFAALSTTPFFLHEVTFSTCFVFLKNYC